MYSDSHIGAHEMVRLYMFQKYDLKCYPSWTKHMCLLDLVTITKRKRSKMLLFYEVINARDHPGDLPF